MNPKNLLRLKTFRRRGMALIIVIGALALATMLLLAMFSLTETEYKSTQSYVAGLSAKQFAETANSIVIAQLQNAQSTANERKIHATQPGMVRVYDPDGSFEAAYALYSSSRMMIQGAETAIFSPALTAPGNWNTMPSRFVDLNEPAVRPSLNGGAGQVSCYFPVIDPRAAYNYIGGTQFSPSNPPPLGTRTTQVEGFWYEKSTPTIGSSAAVTYNTVRMPTEAGGDPNLLRLPMPVEWIYFLQDGTMGTLNASNTFVSATPGVTPGPNNPIVARVAFWADDESCKINVNTASEPTFMAPPYYYHDRDRRWANYPAAASEFQRYPGHPATVALSAVLAPNMRLDPVRPQDDGFAPNDTQSIVDIKEQIYDLAPKISKGGSLSGTLPYMSDEFSILNGEGTTTSERVDTATARAERLYASVDEMLFRDGNYVNQGGRPQRSAAKYTMPGVGGLPIFDQTTLEKSRFFLTAHSRSPEFSIYGLPRVCIWPVADEIGRPGGPPPARLRTNFDNMIALCATLNTTQGGPSVANSYYFRRSQPHHSTHDVTGTASGFPTSQGLQRNSTLLRYLVTQMTSLQWPQTGLTGNSPNFVAKYGADNVNQLAVQFFDYVRCTNLYDGILARNNDANSARGLTSTALYQRKDQLAPLRYTYTEQRITPPATNVDASANTQAARAAAADAGVLPGHGQVTPAVWQTGGRAYMGFGRMFTISEVGLHIICTADGKIDDTYGVNFNGIISGGGTGFRAEPQDDVKGEPEPRFTPAASIPEYRQFTLQSGTAVWWSNFPPIRPGDELLLKDKYGVNTSSPSSPTNKFHPSNHPGYYPDLWNHTLEQNTPLLPTQKRVQAIVLLETFCPMLGWTKFYPEYTIVLDGNYIGQIFLNDKRLFDTTGDIPVKSNSNTYEFTNMHSVGGHASPSAVSGNRGGRPVSGEGVVTMGSDSNWITGNTSGHNGLTNYGLTSNFLTLNRDEPMQLQFRGGGEGLKIDIYDTHNWETAQPVQRIAIHMENATLPTPRLVYNNYPAPEGKGGLKPTELNYHTRTDANGNTKYRRSTQAPHWWVFNTSGALGRQRGRVNPSYVEDPAGSVVNFWQDEPAPYPPAAGDTPVRQLLRGRLDNSSAAQWFVSPNAPPPGWSADGISIIPPEAPVGGASGTLWESDVIRTMVPAVGDYRMIAARREVPPNMWKRHPMWTQNSSDQYTIHTFSGMWGNNDPGYDLPDGKDRKLLVAEIMFGDPNQVLNHTSHFQRAPDLPPHPEWALAANSYGDFDTGIANAREGPYVNKPDEGNFYGQTYTRNSQTKFYRSGYFYDSWRNADDWRSGLYMTPNRMVSSPVMFGSLPTGVWKTGGNGAPDATQGTSLNDLPYRPWQTLLFRPYVMSNTAINGAKQFHPGEAGPRDHFLLDMFFMPVVEPYAISEPLSVAGRINMNYQILPFTNIVRSTGMNAVMKGEFMTAIPNGAAYRSKSFRAQPNTPQVWDQYYDERNTPQQFWHRPINVSETLKQFDERFTHQVAGPGSSGLFRSASQICEMYLIPDVSAGWSVASQESNIPLVGLSRTDRPNVMRTFWANHAPTGDNVRERPYSNLYSRLTTRSNTFRVHVRAQVLKKARSTSSTVFDQALGDSVLSEYRGSTLIERFIDPTDEDNPVPDYAASGNPLGEPPLETFYQYRVLETKRFNP